MGKINNNNVSVAGTVINQSDNSNSLDIEALLAFDMDTFYKMERDHVLSHVKGLLAAHVSNNKASFFWRITRYFYTLQTHLIGLDKIEFSTGKLGIVQQTYKQLLVECFEVMDLVLAFLDKHAANRYLIKPEEFKSCCEDLAAISQALDTLKESTPQLEPIITKITLFLQKHPSQDLNASTSDDQTPYSPTATTPYGYHQSLFSSRETAANALNESCADSFPPQNNHKHRHCILQ